MFRIVQFLFITMNNRPRPQAADLAGRQPRFVLSRLAGVAVTTYSR